MSKKSFFPVLRLCHRHFPQRLLFLKLPVFLRIHPRHGNATSETTFSTISETNQQSNPTYTPLLTAISTTNHKPTSSTLNTPP